MTSRFAFLRRSAALLLLSAGLCPVATAAPFSSIVAYGDSLSDNGNFYGVTGQPPLPYFPGRFSDGPVAVEQLAATWGIPLVNLAWGGATTGIGNQLDGGTPTSRNLLPGVQTVFDSSQAAISPYLSGLFVVWAGPNDFLAPDPGDPFPAGVAVRAVDNLLYVVEGLQSRGVRNILVPGMPDLGLTPFYRSQGPVTAGQASALTDAFNALLASRLSALTMPVTYFDTAGLLRTVAANPAAYGFTNVTGECLSGMTMCATPNMYLFWDDFHPTTAGNAVIAERFAAAAVPEPSTLLLAAAGVVVLIVRRRTLLKRRSKSTEG